MSRFQTFVGAGLILLALGGCGGGESSPASSAAPVNTPAPTPVAPSTPAPSTPAPNSAPTISGTPAATVQVGSSYSFTPTATDPEGNALTFSVSGKPAWAAFNTGSGALTGTPTAAQVGNYANIMVSVSDGTNSRSLPAFSINVTSVGTGMGSATLQWSAPTTNTDGSPLTNLSGYRLYHGTSAAALTDVRTISSPGTTIFVFDLLATGTHYFAISAVSTTGVESTRSAVLSKTI